MYQLRNCHQISASLKPLMIWLWSEMLHLKRNVSDHNQKQNFVSALLWNHSISLPLYFKIPTRSKIYYSDRCCN